MPQSVQVCGAEYDQAQDSLLRSHAGAREEARVGSTYFPRCEPPKKAGEIVAEFFLQTTPKDIE
eukprot:9472410-Lingulodinium_polyedra.AAC.1